YEQLFIYFAGHGGFSQNRGGYIVAADSKPEDEDPDGETGLLYDNLAGKLERSDCKHIFLCLDVCQSGTFDKYIADQIIGKRGDEKENRRLEDLLLSEFRQKTRWIMSSSGPESVSDGKPGHHSPFALHLIDALSSVDEKSGYLTRKSLDAAMELSS